MFYQLMHQMDFFSTVDSLTPFSISFVQCDRKKQLSTEQKFLEMWNVWAFGWCFKWVADNKSDFEIIFFVLSGALIVGTRFGL